MAFLRAGLCTKITGDAKGVPGLRIIVEARRPAVALRHVGPLFGILLGVGGAGSLIGKGQHQPLDKVHQKYFSNEFAERNHGVLSTDVSLSTGSGPPSMGLTRKPALWVSSSTI